MSGTAVPSTQAVVRADDSQRTRGDRVADQLGALEQLGDGVAQVLAADELGVDRRRAVAVAVGRARRGARPGTIGAIRSPMCGGQRRGVAACESMAALHRAALVVAEHDDERHAEHARRRTRGEPITESEMTWPALRTTNRSPRPLSKMISAASRESLQPNSAARGRLAGGELARGARHPGADAAARRRRSARCRAASRATPCAGSARSVASLGASSRSRGSGRRPMRRPVSSSRRRAVP